MYGIILALKESNLFTSIEVLELIEEESVKLLRVKAKVLDKTLLYITELHTIDYQNYSYHWQKENGDLIIRWDNKPHWRNLKTFPYHKHEKGKVLPSYRVNIDDVIKTILDQQNQEHDLCNGGKTGDCTCQDTGSQVNGRIYVYNKRL